MIQSTYYNCNDKTSYNYSPFVLDNPQILYIEDTNGTIDEDTILICRAMERNGYTISKIKQGTLKDGVRENRIYYIPTDKELADNDMKNYWESLLK